MQHTENNDIYWSKERIWWLTGLIIAGLLIIGLLSYLFITGYAPQPIERPWLTNQAITHFSKYCKSESIVYGKQLPYLLLMINIQE